MRRFRQMEVEGDDWILINRAGMRELYRLSHHDNFPEISAKFLSQAF